MLTEAHLKSKVENPLKKTSCLPVFGLDNNSRIEHTE
jgi:hypothetical protein